MPWPFHLLFWNFKSQDLAKFQKVSPILEIDYCIATDISWISLTNQLVLWNLLYIFCINSFVSACHVYIYIYQIFVYIHIYIHIAIYYNMMALDVCVCACACVCWCLEIQMYVFSLNMEDRQFCLLIHLFLLNNPYWNSCFPLTVHIRHGKIIFINYTSLSSLSYLVLFHW